jgi:hypothetical protein
MVSTNKNLYFSMRRVLDALGPNQALLYMKAKKAIKTSLLIDVQHKFFYLLYRGSSKMLGCYEPCQFRTATSSVLALSYGNVGATQPDAISLRAANVRTAAASTDAARATVAAIVRLHTLAKKREVTRYQRPALRNRRRCEGCRWDFKRNWEGGTG